MLRTDNRPAIRSDDTSWRSRFVVASEAVVDGERRALEALAHDGLAERVRRGVYRLGPGPAWPDERHRDLVRAAELGVETPTIFGHRSAAAIWRLPRLDPWPERVELIEHADTVRRSTPGFRRHLTDEPFSTALVEGLTVTSLERTAIDVARGDSVPSALVTMDAALRGIRLDGVLVAADRDAMAASLDLLPGRRGVKGARFVLGFADGLAETPGESLSRLQMHRCGITPPVLQARFVDEHGEMYPDFWWPEFGVAGEFDGMSKYASSPDAVARERRREDRLFRLGVRLVRWDWTTARDRQALAARLRAAGVR